MATLDLQPTKLTDTFSISPATMNDLQAYFDLFDTFMQENMGNNNSTIEDLRSEWTSPNFNMESNTRVVFTKENKLVGYLEIWDTQETPVRPFIWGYVHPEYRGRGIGTELIQWAEQRARQVFDRVPDNARVVMATDCQHTDEASRRLFKSNGMTTERRVWNMLIEMDEAPDAPVWTEGITISTLAEQKDMKAVYIANEEAFKDHRGHVDQSFETGFERWQHWVNNDPNHDPTLWFLAMDGDKIAGISLCREKSWDAPDKGHVNELGVLREYRRKGVALALLKHTFAEMWKRGQRKVSLGVDASSLTGATKLYEKAGMSVERAWDVYEKELRPGVELSNQGQSK
jgi:mycothiol synthase